jgi:hypothetical protein
MDGSFHSRGPKLGKLPSVHTPLFFSRRGVNFCRRRVGKEVCLLATRAVEHLSNLVGGSAGGIRVTLLGLDTLGS